LKLPEYAGVFGVIADAATLLIQAMEDGVDVLSVQEFVKIYASCKKLLTILENAKV
jgi:hypothetical protein